MANGKFDPFHEPVSPYPLHSSALTRHPHQEALAVAQAQDAEKQIKAAVKTIEGAALNFDKSTRDWILRYASGIRRTVWARMSEIEAGKVAKEAKPVLPGDVGL